MPTYTLKKPIEHAGETITELTFRDAVAGDVRSFPLQGATLGHVMDVAGKLSNQTAPVMNAMSLEDLQEVSSLLKLF